VTYALIDALTREHAERASKFATDGHPAEVPSIDVH